MLLLILGQVIGIRTSGFLYSPITNSFISKNDRLSRRETIPLRFTIQTTSNSFRSGRPEEFDVIEINGYDGNGNKLSINQKGEAKLFRKNLCETAHKNFLASERCSSNPRQVFTWVPEHLLDDFVDRLVERSTSSKNNNGSTKEVSKLRKTIDNLSSALQNNKQCGSGMGGSCLKKDGSPGKLHDRIFENYLDFHCKQRSGSSKCQRDQHKHENKLCLKKGRCSAIDDEFKIGSVFPTDLFKEMKQILSLHKMIGPNTDSVYKSNKKRPRKRGIYARGEDEEDIKNYGCTCKLECVRNPKNGQCFYRYNGSGKLEPIMKNERCCKKNKANVCDLPNKIEKYLCELSVKNDYGFFSKFLDDNYSCT